MWHTMARRSGALRLLFLAAAALLTAEAFVASRSPPRLVSFSNDTQPIWVPASLHANHTLLRPATLNLSAPAAAMTVLVSAAPDVKNAGRTLALYRLYVNGIFLGIGPGRGDGPVSPEMSEAVYDRIEVPLEVLQRSSAAGRVSRVSVALQCYSSSNADAAGGGSDKAWAMLEAQISDAAGKVIGRFHTNTQTWFGHNADAIFKAGVPDSGSAYLRVNEDLDAAAARLVEGWQMPGYAGFAGRPGVWTRVEGREELQSAPHPKSTLPLAVTTGLAPSSVVKLGAGHYFFDFGRERMGGMSLTIPAATVTAWGGAGTQVEARFSEQLAHFNAHEVLYPGCPLDCGNWNKIPQWQSMLTLAGGDKDNHFEHHEYIGLFRYAELRVKSTWFPKDAGKDAVTMTQWAVAYPIVEEEEADAEAAPTASLHERQAAFFASSSTMLDAVWQLCADTIRYTSLDTFTDSNVRERLPYEADGFVASTSYWALTAERAWSRHSTRYILNNPTWPTEWKQYAVMLVHGHYMQTGDASLADDTSHTFGQLLNQTMLPFIDPASDLVNFTASRTANMGGSCPFGGDGPLGCNSPMCHADADMYPPGINDPGGRSCDNIDWLPKFRAGYKFSATSTIVNAFAARTLDMMAELANATGRPAVVAQHLSAQAQRTRAAMLEHMYDASTGLWCDGLCSGPNSTGLPGTFHSQHYALWLGATPDDGQAVRKALAYLKGQGMVGSTYSANSLLHGLYARAAGLDYGQAALDLMTQCGDHSWCHMLQAGATATWEHWYPHDGTHSHPWASSPASAIAGGLFGVRPRTPGWATFGVKVAPGNLTAASIVVPTPRGPITANFTRRGSEADGEREREGEGEGSEGSPSSTLDLGIPAGAAATGCMPLFVTMAPHTTLTGDGGASGGAAGGAAGGAGGGGGGDRFVFTLDGVPQPTAHLDDAGAYLCLDGVKSETGRRVRAIAVAPAS